MDRSVISAKMGKAVDVLKGNFSAIRTGRANPALIENIMVDAYGSKMPLQQLASITAPEARMLLVNPFDKSNTQLVEKAIQTADLGLNPQDDGHLIRIVLPDLNEERRKEFVKQIKQYAEEARVSVRNVRRDAMEEIKKNEDLSDDLKHNEQDDVQKQTNSFISQIDELAATKESEVMTL